MLLLRRRVFLKSNRERFERCLDDDDADDELRISICDEQSTYDVRV